MFRAIASNWAALIVNVVVSFILAPYVVNKLGNVYYGVWALILQFTGYLYLLDFGVRESVVRYVSKYVARRQSERLNAVLTTALRVYIPITLACVFLTLVSAVGVDALFNLDTGIQSEARWTTVLVGLTVAQVFMSNVFTGVQYGLQRFELANLVGVAFNLVRSGLIVVFLELGFGIVALAAIQFGVMVASSIAGVFIALHLLRKLGMPFRPVKIAVRRRRALTARVFGYGWYVLVNNVGQKLIFASGAVIVGIFQPVVAVTYYAIAGSLIDHLRSLMQSTAQVFNPLSSQLHAMGKFRELGETLRRGSKLSVLIALPIAGAYAILGSEFIGLWMGPEYADPAGEVLLVLAVTQIVSAPHLIISSVLYGISQHRIMAYIRIGEAAVNLCLSIILVRRFGIVGVAMGTAVAHILVVGAIVPATTCGLVGLRLGSYYASAYLRPLLASVPFGVVAWWFASKAPAANLVQFFEHVTILLALYLPCAYFVALTKDERKLLKALVLKRSDPAPT